eukprot:TRINITY_DN3527_c0_g1_i2.p1 TRINITY_DN3527_c0_g1~~TRINITY_DN3527_c0_g1_i2.p1  ORF type:complete len:600 (-),score=135.36 TRINITY_DN3527_c0_g1_i2:126-1925(-)
MNRTRTRPGARLLRQWFVQPVLSISEMYDLTAMLDYVTPPCSTARLDTLSVLTSGANAGLLPQLQKALSQVRDLPPVLLRLRTASASERDFQALYHTTSAFLQVQALCQQFTELEYHSSVLHKMATVNAEPLSYVASLVGHVIDFEVSCAQGRSCVRTGVHPPLDSLRQCYVTLDDILAQLVADDCAALGVADLHGVYYPQLGFLIALPASPDLTVEMPLAFLFRTEQFSYYKSSNCRTLDETIGDIVTQINDEEARVIRELTECVLQHEAALLGGAPLLAELDVLASLAAACAEFDYARPVVTADNVVRLRAARHPLKALAVDTFIPNDVEISPGASVKIVTGPNLSGKSVYLKQVGLIVFMAHVGLFVPAEAATIGVCDAIYTRIRTRECASEPLSTFMKDCSQVVKMLRDCTERSLLLIDEFGKGTDPDSGVALLCGVVQHLAEASEHPKALVSTHFLEALDFIDDRPPIEVLAMDFVLEPSSAPSADEDGVVFLYRAVRRAAGTVRRSYAYHCARLAGVPDTVVRRAAVVERLLRDGVPVRRLAGGCSEPDEQEQQEDARYGLDRRLLTLVATFLDFDCERGDVDELRRRIAEAQ